jgi:hypothetical protein
MSCAVAQPTAAAAQTKQDLYQVWIDLTFGQETPDWWWNSPPQPLAGALRESSHARALGWICRVLPLGMNPRPDGRWDNP